MAQLVGAPPCHGGGREFESLPGRYWWKSVIIKYYGILAQLGEHLPYKQRVIGSSPIGPIYYGWIPEWPKGTDCKSAGDAFEGSNPSPSTWWIISSVVANGYAPMWLNWQSSWFVISRLSVRVRSSAFSLKKNKISRDGAVWKLVGLITRRS